MDMLAAAKETSPALLSRHAMIQSREAGLQLAKKASYPDLEVMGGYYNQGKMQEIEERVERHEAYLQRFAGVATAVGALVTLFHVAIDFLRMRH